MSGDATETVLVPERLHDEPVRAKLVYLALREQPYATAAELSDATGLSPSSIRRATQELAERGEITTHQSASDGRQKVYALSNQ